MSDLKTFTCHTCGWTWQQGQNGNHDCTRHVVQQREMFREQLSDREKDLAAMQRRAEGAEFREQEWKRAAKTYRSNLDTAQHARGVENDLHSKDIADLQKRLATSEERRGRLVKAVENSEPSPEMQHQLEHLQAKLKFAQEDHDRMQAEFQHQGKGITQLIGIVGGRENESLKDATIRMVNELTAAENVLIQLGCKPMEQGWLIPSGEARRHEMQKQIEELKRENEILRQRNLTDPLIATTTKHLEAQIAELTRQRDRLSKTLDSLGFSGKLFAGGGEQEADAGQSSNLPGAGKTTLPDYTEAQLEACERENERLRTVIDGIQNLLSLAE